MSAIEKLFGGKRAISITRKMQLLLTLLLILQAVLFYGAIFYGGTITKLENSAMSILNERTEGRKKYFEGEMVQRWMNVSDTVDAVLLKTDELTDENGVGISGMLDSNELCVQLLEDCSSDIISMLRRNVVTGAFIILDTRESPKLGQSGTMPGLYIRDLNPASISSNNSDLLIERSPTDAARKLDIPMDTWWQPQFSFPTAESGSFFYTTADSVGFYPELSYKDLGHWSRPFKLSGESDIPAIVYSVPLIDNGKAYGVLGVEVSLSYMRSLLPYDEVALDKRGAYMLASATGEGDMDFAPAVVNGSMYGQMFGENSTINLHDTPELADVYKVNTKSKSGEQVYGCVKLLQPYNSNTPYENERWALISLTRGVDLFETSNGVSVLIIISLLVSLAMGLIGVALLARMFTEPITALVGRLRNSDPEKPVVLQKTNISEIDELAFTIEQLSQNLSDSASRTSKIIKMTGISLGAFEKNGESERVFCTDGMLDMIGLEHTHGTGNYVDEPVFRQQMERLASNLEETAENGGAYVMRLQHEKEDSCWVRLRIATDGTRTLGTLVNITQEILEKRKLEYERDYDLLTNLLNRRAFYSALHRLFSHPEKLGVAALVMMDLDNLKFVNDLYGHDAGDLYLSSTARVLRRFSADGAISSRMSGDEFFVFFYGYEDKEKLRVMIARLKEKLAGELMTLPDGSSIKVRVSAGVAWYPDDSGSYEQLIKYADFAMYKVKKTTKGEFVEFDIASYNRDSYLLSCSEELNRFVEEELVEYHFQPIVDTKTGEAFAYEALMRPQLPALRSPPEIIALARSQAKLYQIERLTWFGAMKGYSVQRELFGDCLLFINSIPNQTMTNADFEEFETKYADDLSRIVMELTEEEKLDEKSTREKKEHVVRWNSHMALDDFGTGYNGESLLLTLIPDYIKIDMSIIRGIDQDEGRQSMLRNIVGYAARRDIKIIAEGVETYEEMRAVISLGADFIQGYYTGRPRAVPEKIPSKIRNEIIEAAGHNFFDENV